MQSMVLIGSRRCSEGGANVYEGMMKQLFRYGLQHYYTMLKGWIASGIYVFIIVNPFVFNH